MHATEVQTGQGTGAVYSKRRYAILAMLLAVYICSFIDRLLLSILAEPVKADLSLSDTQMGLLGGLAFALLYSTMGVPLALVADRIGKSKVITISLVAWSGFTAACGFATNFWQMFLARLGVGVGEAGGSAPSFALISENFPPEQRARATGIYMMGIPIGSAAGAFLGAWIASQVDWRLAFIAMGIVGVMLAVPFRMIVRDNPTVVTRPAKAAPIRESFAILVRRKLRPVFANRQSQFCRCSFTRGAGKAQYAPMQLGK